MNTLLKINIAPEFSSTKQPACIQHEFFLEHQLGHITICRRFLKAKQCERNTYSYGYVCAGIKLKCVTLYRHVGEAVIPKNTNTHRCTLSK